MIIPPKPPAGDEIRAATPSVARSPCRHVTAVYDKIEEEHCRVRGFLEPERPPIGGLVRLQDIAREQQPMPVLLAKQRVQDFWAWKKAFEEQGAVRRSQGVTGVKIYRNIDDPCDLVIILEWDTLAQARDCLETAELEVSAAFVLDLN